jgi:soluble lytic murein transglycosylase-like protein
MKPAQKKPLKYAPITILLLYVFGASATLGSFAGKLSPEIADAGTSSSGIATRMRHREPSGLPTVLSQSDVARYREIFSLQDIMDWQAADEVIAQLDDRRLMGHVLAQRFLHPEISGVQYDELRAWLSDYADHPEARLIYKLALKQRPKGARRPVRPMAKPDSLAKAFIVQPPETYQSSKVLTAAQRQRVRRLQREIRRNLRRTKLSATEKLLQSREVKQLFDRVQFDEASAGVAAGWLYLGKYEKAYRMAGEAAIRSGLNVPLAHWTSGLAAWKLGRIESAASHFGAIGQAADVSSWVAAAGAYWAARAHERLGEHPKMIHWLLLAARHSRTFYGMLAQQRLHLSSDLAFEFRQLRYGQVAPLLGVPEGGRALALLQLGERHRAEQELMGLEGWHQPKRMTALLALAEFARLPALSLRLAKRLVDSDKEAWSAQRLDTWLYPIPPWNPENGFIVDRALIFAVMRQESSFNPFAVSPDDARGLMQLLPTTADTVAKGRRFHGNHRRALFEPELNIELGQRYLRRLLDLSVVKGDLFRLAVAYNAGPGNLRKWQRQMDFGEDPLLFIELLPVLETRLFIERVFTNLWAYRKRLGQPTPSLESLAAGRWPRYQAMDQGGTRAASMPGASYSGADDPS